MIKSKPVKNMKLQQIVAVFDDKEPDSRIIGKRQAELETFYKKIEKLMIKYRVWSIWYMLVPKD